MKFVSPLLKRLIYPALRWSGGFRRCARRGELSVVTYHGVLPPDYTVSDPLLDGGWVTARAFRQQLGLLQSRYAVVSPEQVRQWSRGEAALPPRAVLLTCDDGLANASIQMLPILREENLPCLFFVTGESLNESPAMLWYEDLYLTLRAAPAGKLKANLGGIDVEFELSDSIRQRHSQWWNLVSRLSTQGIPARLEASRAVRDYFGMPGDWPLRYVEAQASRFRILAPLEIEHLLNEGMTVGSHTLSHPKLSRLSAEMAWEEISESRVRLEKALRAPVWSIAYPFGGTDSVSQREVQMAERAGYDCAFVNFGGGFGPNYHRFRIPRVHVTLEMTLPEFEGHLSGLHESLRRRFGYEERIPSSPDETKQAVAPVE